MNHTIDWPDNTRETHKKVPQSMKPTIIGPLSLSQLSTITAKKFPITI